LSAHPKVQEVGDRGEDVHPKKEIPRGSWEGQIGQVKTGNVFSWELAIDSMQTQSSELPLERNLQESKK